MQHLYIKLAEKDIAKQHNDGEMPESIIPLTTFHIVSLLQRPRHSQ
jgi:hypothetical protein